MPPVKSKFLTCFTTSSHKTDLANEEESFDQQEDGELQVECRTRNPRPRKHWCRYCPYLSTSSSGLVLHERTHTGEKPFRCRFCTRAFPRQAYLVSHERVHMGEKPFSCRFCHKRFGEQSNRIRHERLHTGERPFKCEICGKRYTDSSNLRSHQKKCSL
ncbi:hypothetical protein ISCGN_019789 [Ixodes scapularis]